MYVFEIAAQTTRVLGCFLLFCIGVLAAQEPKSREVVPGHKSGAIQGFFSPDGKMLVTRANNVLLWDVATGKKTSVGEGLPDPLMFSPDGKSLILTRDPVHEVQIVDVVTKKTTVVMTKGSEQILALSPDGKAQVVWNNKSVVLRALKTPYDTTTGRDVVAMPKVNTRRLGAGNPPMKFSPDGRLLLIKDADFNIMLWDVSTGKSRTLPKTAGSWFFFSPDSKTLLAECGTEAKITSSRATDNPSVQLFDVATGKSLATFGESSTMTGSNLVFSPDGKSVAVSNVKLLTLWDTSTGKLRRTFNNPDRAMHTPRFTPDGRFLVLHGDRRSFLFWNVATGKLAASIPRESSLLAFSPVGAMLATSEADGRIRFWDMPASSEKK